MTLAPKTATATDSPDGSLSDDATAVQLSESPASGEIWYVEGFFASSDGAGANVTASDYQIATAIWPSDVSDADVGSKDPTSNTPTRGATTATDLGQLLADAHNGTWISVGDLLHPNDKAVLNVNSDGTASGSTVTYRFIGRQVV